MKKIILPEELYKKLDLSETEEVEVVDIAQDSFTIRALGVKRREYAASWFLLPTIISTIIFIVLAFSLNHSQVIPLSGSNSIATATIVVANAISILTFIIAYFIKRKELYHMMTKKIYWRTFLTVIVSIIIITTLALSALFWFTNQIFYGVSFGLFTSTLIFAIFSGILNYILIFVVDTFEISMLVNMLIMVAIGGLISSMATNGDQYWWQRNFSLLGTEKSHASLQFNLTLIISAALMIALFDYIFVSLREKYGRHIRYIVLQTLLMLCALCIALVGFIPNNGTGLAHHIHDISAQLIVLFMALAIFGIRWFLPRINKNIYVVSYIIVTLIAISFVLWHFVHYLTLTAFEILSFSLSFAWMMLLINNLLSLLWNNRKVYKVSISSDN
ncbi:DUF998 domain-containing protein [Lactococcus nasutitermitis]|uniref:DUF998 domain-containing protein n=1 Tax=Lactococcus nasutitermitis TaxID=1652957 RepID=A0ABV9JDM2_9LACT|nr:DUF998 domain-containing protein [Lactococcus nasutitermitis]